MSSDWSLMSCVNFVRLSRYFYYSFFYSWKTLDKRKFSDCCYSMGRHKKNISNFVKTSTSVQVSLNPVNLHTLLIHLNRGNSCKNRLREFGLRRVYYEFTM